MRVADWFRRFCLVYLAWLCLACLGGDCRVARAAEYLAFSLQQAETQLRGGGQLASQARQLGGITDPVALIYDQQTRDLILVGRVDRRLAELTMADFVVALRSIRTHRRWPLVSIDKDENTYTTKRQRIRFEGGIADSAFGRDALDADVLLKNLAFGATKAQVWGVTPYFDLLCRQAARGETRQHVRTLFWFIGDQRASGFVDREGVAVVDKLTLAVEARVVAAAGAPADRPGATQDPIGTEFATTLSASFEDLAQEFPILRRIRALCKLVAMAAGITALEQKYTSFHPDVTYWLNEYQVPLVRTPADYPLVEKERTVSSSGKSVRVGLDGGLEFKELILDLRDGSLTALRDVVLKCRPDRLTLVWSVPLEHWNALESLRGRGVVHDPKLDDLLQKLERAVGVTLDAYIGNSRDSVERARQLPAVDSAGFRPSMPSFRSYEGLATAANIGGVMLAGRAQVEGAKRAEVSLAGGNFALVVDGKDARIAPEAYRKFITALWCVYYSQHDPGISIDPISPDVDKHLVRYIGRVINTDLGRVMREADYLMKKWAVGTEHPAYRGFQSVDARSARTGLKHIGVSRRFWFVPDELRFRRGGDLLLFDAGRMRLNTEYDVDGMRGQASLADEAFAKFFTDHYHGIAEKYPVYKELFEYAKLVSLARYLKDQGVPLHWFLIAHKDLVLTEDSPGTVAELAKGSDYFRGVTIKGGVDLKTDGQYVYDEAAVSAIRRALAQRPAEASSTAQPQSMPLAAGQPLSFELDRRNYTVAPQHSLVSGKDQRGISYQTDLALRQNGKPGLELVRYYDPRRRQGGQFGAGWRLLIPYEVEPADDVRIDFLNAKIPQRMVVENQLSGQREVLSFSPDRYAAAGYVPEKTESSQVVGLFLMSNASFRLADKLGNQFRFDPSGRLTDMFLSNDPEHHVCIEYLDKFSSAFAEPPYAVEPVGEQRTEFLNVTVPRQIKVTDLVNRCSEVLTFHDKAEVSGYLPDSGQSSRFQHVALLSDAGLRLADKHGNQVRFNPAWRFESMLSCRDRRMVRSVTMGGRRETFHYTIDNEGQVVVASAALSDDTESARPTYVVHYEYDGEGRLCRVDRPEPFVAAAESPRGPALSMVAK